MKTKLLKKLRKRYQILHYPNGLYWRNQFIEGPYTVLYDNGNEYRSHHSSNKPKEEAYKDLHAHLVRWIELDYGPFKSQRNRPVELLWYKNNSENKSIIQNFFISLLKKFK